MATPSVSPLRFRGAPRSVEGLSVLTAQRPLTAALSLNLKLPRSMQAAPFTVQTEPIGSTATRLRFSLPESTPPGTYEGTVQIGPESYPVTVEVEPHAYLAISPRQLILVVEPGSEVTSELTIVNSGNVPCEITKAHAFGLFDVKGADRALGAALADPQVKGEARLARLMDEAADNHGGLVRVAIRDGADVIEPGEVRTLRVALRFSEHLKPGQSYWGTWPLYNLQYYVKVDVTRSAPPAPKRSATHKESS